MHPPRSLGVLVGALLTLWCFSLTGALLWRGLSLPISLRAFGPYVAATFRCTIVSPTNQLLDGEITYASIPLWDGLMGILPGRAPIVASLGTGELRVDFPAEGAARWIQVVMAVNPLHYGWKLIKSLLWASDLGFWDQEFLISLIVCLAVTVGVLILSAFDIKKPKMV